MKSKKYERIRLVESFRLNAEDSILISVDDKNDYEDFLKNLDNCSIRTEKVNSSVGNWLTPHYPFVPIDQASALIDGLRYSGYYVILGKPINPDDCLFAGAARKYGPLEHLYIEIANGPGTVRRVTHEYKVDQSYDIQSRLETTNDSKVNECIQNFRKVPLTDIIFEFSYYKPLVGIKNEHFICWEIVNEGKNNFKWK
jgi:hypothetical protein|tara:strand:- start:7268 stop:7861 length:594 start_codon:yes stop_codon:yes gene_type:complete